jgi:hypothetical protein
MKGRKKKKREHFAIVISFLLSPASNGGEKESRVKHDI